MSDNTLKACFLGLLAVLVIMLGVLVGLGHNSGVTDALLAVGGGIATLGIWERLKPVKK